jgi:hypothetical protein
LNIKDARQALELAKKDLVSEKTDEEIFWFNPGSVKGDTTGQAHLLASYDEFLISYKNRSASLANEHHKHALSNNGIFWPVVIVSGRVAGLWKRAVRGKKVLVDLELFKKPDQKTKKALEKRAAEFGNFLGKTAEVKFQLK